MKIALAIPNFIAAQNIKTRGKTTKIVNAHVQNFQLSAAQARLGELTQNAPVILNWIVVKVMFTLSTQTVSAIQLLNAAQMHHSLILTALTLIVGIYVTAK